ncbi:MULTISPECIES: LLM class flavin-dependent oxidoreductase [Rhizobium]|uniref:FMN-dependent oxidoreductase, nitrilotriacetate monooxygenase family n=1 Tax=Rhizobium favelukesii TaxID=348824 RepID=W6RSU9_9HYPH|nr:MULTISPECIES: LLM class flavin-dependent oxidoreductase [Rhizobium]MCS0458732.1 LLM class flavin-dependent oxidoreductase [Rhizobium favelukesii]UFS79622.1 LLM class flavin-dependent oxidoreductase [Rhizobium sp. T136]CDM63245.1 FMN-dependent oxidoreductase, nitrilotriacetate monooxygenase family [Rhizobium favelukesii]
MKQMQIYAFDMNSVGHINHGMWTHPRDTSLHYTDLDYWVDLARTAERGKLDGIFLADIVGVYDVYKGSPAPVIEAGAQIPVNDPLMPISAMAYVTKHLGFGVTVNTTYEPPFLLARRMSTLDHLTKGRIGWNIVTGYLDSAARAMGFEALPEHDARYDAADEYLEILYKLWEGSWDDEAVLRDKSRAVFADASKVRAVRHEGPYYKMEAIHLAQPSPQRTPLLFQAGASARGQAFAARHAECVFIAAPTPQAARPTVEALRRKALLVGRGADALRVLGLVTVVVGRTQKEAKDKLEDYRRHASVEACLAHYSASTGIDLSRYGLDDPIEQKSTNANQSALAAITREAREPVTLRQIIDQMVLGSRMQPIVGSAEQVADRLGAWVLDAGVDGFNLARTVAPESLRDFVDLVVPVLQERGLFKADYAEGPLRQKLFGGSGRLPSSHPAAAFRY